MSQFPELSTQWMSAIHEPEAEHEAEHEVEAEAAEVDAPDGTAASGSNVDAAHLLSAHGVSASHKPTHHHVHLHEGGSGGASIEESRRGTTRDSSYNRQDGRRKIDDRDGVAAPAASDDDAGRSPQGLTNETVQYEAAAPPDLVHLDQVTLDGQTLSAQALGADLTGQGHVRESHLDLSEERRAELVADSAGLAHDSVASTGPAKPPPAMPTTPGLCPVCNVARVGASRSSLGNDSRGDATLRGVRASISVAQNAREEAGNASQRCEPNGLIHEPAEQMLGSDSRSRVLGSHPASWRRAGQAAVRGDLAETVHDRTELLEAQLEQALAQTSQWRDRARDAEAELKRARLAGDRAHAQVQELEGEVKDLVREVDRLQQQPDGIVLLAVRSRP